MRGGGGGKTRFGWGFVAKRNDDFLKIFYFTLRIAQEEILYSRNNNWVSVVFNVKSLQGSPCSSNKY